MWYFCVERLRVCMSDVCLCGKECVWCVYLCDVCVGFVCGFFVNLSFLHVCVMGVCCVVCGV